MLPSFRNPYTGTEVQRDSSAAQADAFVPQNHPGCKKAHGSEHEKTNRPAPLGMTVFSLRGLCVLCVLCVGLFLFPFPVSCLLSAVNFSIPTQEKTP